MFTGIIESTGTVLNVDLSAAGARLRIAAPEISAPAALGDSVSVNGVCLTVVESAEGTLSFDAVQETLARSSLGSLSVGQRVNLERPVRVGDRLDGHIVQGHVDATATLDSVVEEGNARRLRFQAAPELLRYVVQKGSIAVEGISLTVAGLGSDWFEVAIIPHTWAVTNLGDKKPGDVVNVEVDVLAKYVERLLGPVPAQKESE